MKCLEQYNYFKNIYECNVKEDQHMKGTIYYHSASLKEAWKLINYEKYGVIMLTCTSVMVY